MPLITRQYEIDAGHRLVNHEGKCKKLHGHRYVFLLHLEGEELDDVGRVLDFADCKRLLADVVEPWDHRMLLNEKDTIVAAMRTGVLDDYDLIDEDEILPVPFNPTAENMAEYIAAEIASQVPPTYRLRVEVRETPNCTAFSDWLNGGAE